MSNTLLVRLAIPRFEFIKDRHHGLQRLKAQPGPAQSVRIWWPSRLVARSARRTLAGSHLLFVLLLLFSRHGIILFRGLFDDGGLARATHQSEHWESENGNHQQFLHFVVLSFLEFSQYEK
jgi:hypothetical protein